MNVPGIVMNDTSLTGLLLRGYTMHARSWFAGRGTIALDQHVVLTSLMVGRMAAPLWTVFYCKQWSQQDMGLVRGAEEGRKRRTRRGRTCF